MTDLFAVSIGLYIRIRDFYEEKHTESQYVNG